MSEFILRRNSDQDKRVCGTSLPCRLSIRDHSSIGGPAAYRFIAGLDEKDAEACEDAGAYWLFPSEREPK